MKLILIALSLPLAAQNPSNPEPPKPTHEQQLEKRVADLEKYIAASEEWNRKDKMSIVAAYQACIGQPPQPPAAPKEPAK